MNLEIAFENLQHAANTHGNIVLIVSIAIPILLTLSFVSARLIKNRRIAFIETNAESIAQLNEINAKFQPLFCTDIGRSQTIQRNLNSKRKFDHFDSQRTMFGIVCDEFDSYREIISKLQHNRDVYSNYKKTCDCIFENSPVPDSLPRILFKDEKSYIRLEQEIFDKKMINPARTIKIVLKWGYTSPKGRNSYRNSKTFDFNDIAFLVEKAQERRGHERSKEYQRSLMSQGLRYNILQRDGFRCRLCGRSAKDHPGLELEVDHIVPVSKGGLTIESNLQTLCRDCNRGKAAKTM